MNSNAVYITIDTTGLPGRIPGWRPQVVAIGLARVRASLIEESFGGLVQRPRDHVMDERARGAFRANGLDPEAVINAPTTEARLAQKLQRSLHGATLRGFNVDFLRPMLDGHPWYLASWGSCVMQDAAIRIKGPGIFRITMNQALEWAAEQGHDVLPPENPACRAHANAVRVAKLALALEK